MRLVIFGAGAIGGVVGARLHESGYAVTLIARGAHLNTIREHGLTLVTPDQRTVLAIDAVGDPGEIAWSGDEIVLLATKSQDTLGALTALRVAAGAGVPVVCLQNGVENERVALRLIDHVYGAVVMSPTAHLEPGVVEAYGTEYSGIIDLGRYPSGVDATVHAVADALAASQFLSSAVADVMRLKYAKLLLNLRNAVRALCGPGERSDELARRAIDEGRAALTAASIAHEADHVSDIFSRWQTIGVQDIAGRERAGSSTWQSLARGTGAVETDYLNGEIALVGRLHGVPTPVNDALCRIMARVASAGGRPGSVAVDAVLAAAA